MKNFSYKNHFRAVMPFFKLYPLKQDLFYANKHKKSSLFCIFAKGMIHNYIYYEKVAFRKKIKQCLKILKTSIAKVNSRSQLLIGVSSTEAAFTSYLQ